MSYPKHWGIDINKVQRITHVVNGKEPVVIYEKNRKGEHMDQKYYLAYIEDGSLNFGYIKNICNCEKCKERGESEIFINNLDDSYLDCIKYKEGATFCDEIVYTGNSVIEAIVAIEKHYNNKINMKAAENNFLQTLIDFANKKLIEQI